MKFQITDTTGSWWNISADKNEAATIFDSRSEAESVIPELAAALECDVDQLCIAVRNDL